MQHGLIAAVGAVVVLMVVLAIMFRGCYLDSVLPPSWQKGGCAPAAGGGAGTGDSFRGAYGRSPAMQQCLLQQQNGPSRNPFNACMWV